MLLVTKNLRRYLSIPISQMRGAIQSNALPEPEGLKREGLRPREALRGMEKALCVSKNLTLKARYLCKLRGGTRRGSVKRVRGPECQE